MFPVLDVLARLCINVLLGQAKVNNVDDVLVLCMVSTHQEVLWLDIPVDQVFRVHVLNSSNLQVRTNKKVFFPMKDEHKQLVYIWCRLFT